MRHGLLRQYRIIQFTVTIFHHFLDRGKTIGPLPYKLSKAASLLAFVRLYLRNHRKFVELSVSHYRAYLECCNKNKPPSTRKQSTITFCLSITYYTKHFTSVNRGCLQALLTILIDPPLPVLYPGVEAEKLVIPHVETG